MLRWKYVIPRLVVAGFLLFMVWLAANPLLRWSLILGGQAATGAKVEISKLRSLLSRTELQLAKLQVADPQSPMKNLFEAESAVLDVDLGHLLRRRLVVNEGRLQGVQLGTPRTSSGALPGSSPPERQGPAWTDKAADAGEKWLEDAAERLEMQIENDLQSVAVGRELMQRWPQEYDRIEEQAKSLGGRSEDLVRLVKLTKEQPLQSVEHYQRILTETSNLRREMFQLREDLARLQQQMRSDRVAIEQAKQHDQEYIQQRLQLATLDPEAISNYLLGPEMGPRVSGLVHWLQWGRAQLPTSSEAPPPAARGWDVILPGMFSRPSLLVRKLIVDGGGESGGKPFSFAGTIEGLTPQPALYGKPATVNIRTNGSVGMLINAVLDHTSDTARDRIQIDCPQLNQPPRSLGSPDKLTVQVGPSSARLKIDLDLAGDDLNGSIEFYQPEVALKTEASEKLGGELVADRITRATSALRELRALVRLEGTLRQPRWSLDSNLGTQLSEGLRSAFSQELEERQQQLLTRANQEIDEQLQRVQQEIDSKREQLLSKLNLSNEELQFLQNELARLNLPGKLIGDNGLLRRIFPR